MASASDNAPAVEHGAVERIGCPAPPWRGGWRMDGRFGRCAGCGQVQAFCGPCASVRARCASCAVPRRLALHRRANRAYSRSAAGRASGRERQARFRAGRRGGVTDGALTEESPSSTTSLPSVSVVEAARTEELSSDESAIASLPCRLAPPIGVARCVRCGRVLSGRVRPSERSPERRRRRPRQSTYVQPP